MGGACSGRAASPVGEDRPLEKEPSLGSLFKKYPSYENASGLAALGTWPVADVLDYFDKGDILGKGGYGEVFIVSKKDRSRMANPLSLRDVPDAGKFAMKSIAKMRKGTSYM